jgi:sialic acid synthase SpsE
MASLGDVERVVQLAKEFKCKELSFLHCVSAYPCSIAASNLKRIKILINSFDCIVGYSDHTNEIETPSIAAAMGARIIEKHVTMSRLQSGPDHFFSLEPDMQKKMINMLRQVEVSITAKGNLNNSELWSRVNLRRSIYASKDLERGDILTEGNMTIKSPGDGLAPSYYEMLIGKRIIQNVNQDNPITWGDLLNE